MPGRTHYGDHAVNALTLVPKQRARDDIAGQARDLLSLSVLRQPGDNSTC